MSVVVSSDEDFVDCDTLCFTLEDGAMAEVIGRLNEIDACNQKRVFFLSLHALAATLGEAKWAAKKDIVGEHIAQNFAHRFSEPDWFLQLNAKSCLLVLPTIQAHKGARMCAQFWEETGQFFIGKTDDLKLPLFEVKVGDADLLLLQRIVVDKYFDPPSHAEAQAAERVAAAPAPEAVHATQTSPNFEDINLKSIADPTEFLRKMGYGVTCALEPIFDLKHMGLIGYNLEIAVNSVQTGRPVETANAKMPWQHSQIIDFTGICMAFKILDSWSAEKRKPVLFLPISFTTLASAQARSGILPFVAKRAEKIGVKVFLEIKDVKSVPLYKLIEVSSYVKPFCVAVVGHLGSASKDVFDIKQYRLSGVAFNYDERLREDKELYEWFLKLGNTVKNMSGSCMVKGLIDFKQISIAKKAGITHATLKTKPLMAI
jgi:hypothetical protein